MRIISFERADGTQSYGTTDGEIVRDAGATLSTTYPDLKALLQAGAVDALDGAGAEIPLAEVTLLPPIPRPDKILCIGLNYLPHILETGRPKPEKPSIFTRYPESVVGHGAPIVRPSASHKHDYEGELAVIIGKAGRHISEADAWDHILGYSCFNDGSIRDYQNHTTQFWPGKNFEKSGSFGPWIVTKDETGDIREQTLTTRIDGQVEQHTPISDLAIGIPELIAYASTVATLMPGDVIATGTPGGVGNHREPQLFLAPGMVAEVEITGVGTLTNPVVDEET
ncbi:5-oxopent-3-ene-1,2,5-tricarboxylate decarboxylase [Rhodobacterales bacterium HKCCE3408]|nr:5-oxopent-3-ene-1,2,5-tricarboxylate decarboxylase [Rhodobacterales bacterium HKCCE3408]